LKYRNRTEIIPLVLEAANGGANKTKIMYSTFLSYAQLKEYLSILIENGLVIYEDATKRFRTTEKGIRMLQTYNYINEEFDLFDPQTISRRTT
jgi:predicted transcriptional regulator